MKRQLRLPLILLVAATLACTLTPAPSTPGGVESELQTRVAATLTALAVTPVAPATDTPVADTPTPAAPAVLPHPLYFLSDSSGTFQVWRVAVDGATLTQITDEPAPVMALDASPGDGTLAYVSGNQLILADRDGGSRRVLVAGAELPTTPDETYWSSEITSPLWSPDGSRLAYGLNGISVIDPASGGITPLIGNVLPPPEDPASIRLYRPRLWSLDGGRLLADVSFYEAGSLVIIPAAGGSPLETSIPTGIVCCHPAWSNDGSAVYVANDSVGLLSPGLSRIDAATGTGVTLIPGDVSGTFNFVGWPKPAPDGRLMYFFSQTTTFPDRGTWPTSMYVSDADGVTGRTQLRTDSYIPGEALWAPDGSLAVITDVSEFTTVYPLAGPLRLLRVDNSAVLTLADFGRNLRWGR